MRDFHGAVIYMRSGDWVLRSYCFDPPRGKDAPVVDYPVISHIHKSIDIYGKERARRADVPEGIKAAFLLIKA